MGSTESANTLFHYTGTLKNLCSILDNGLYTRYCLENYEELEEEDEIAFPMACLCDIPLTRISEHVEKYGKYGIGLTKEWGIKNNFSPVLYVHNKSKSLELISFVEKNLSDFFDISNQLPDTPPKTVEKPFSKNRYLKNNPSAFINRYKMPDKSKEEILEYVKSAQFELANFIRYIKPYIGKLYRSEDDKYLQGVNFYNEREWRFTPKRDELWELDVKDSYDANNFKQKLKRRKMNMRIAEKFKFTFAPEDIKYILVNSDDEIPGMIDHIENINWPNSSTKKMKILLTKIISLNSIEKDF